jgi:hypothetical protein
MVVRNLMIGLSILFSLANSTLVQAMEEDPYEGEKYGEIRFYKMSKIKSVAVKKNGAWSEFRSSSDETPETCGKFQLKEKDVRRYFRIGRRVSRGDYLGSLDASRCYAEGDIAFENGDKGTWFIDRFGGGAITLEDGRNLYWYCPKCRWRPFSY